jgi:hypothetical protein
LTSSTTPSPTSPWTSDAASGSGENFFWFAQLKSAFDLRKIPKLGELNLKSSYIIIFKLKQAFLLAASWRFCRATPT